MSNYSATVVKIDSIRPHSNADRLVCTSLYGNNVIVGKDCQVGDIGLFFPIESQLGEQFAIANDLLRRKDENGKPAGGMFDASRRVRAQTFRGERSMGFFAPLSYLQATFDSLGKPMPSLNVGDMFEVLGDVEISKKYIVPSNKREQVVGMGKAAKAKRKASRIIPEMFNFHFDTSHLARNLHKITPEAMVGVSWKFHGTSAIAAHTLVKRPLTWLEKLTRKFGAKVQDTEWDYVYSSRKVIKSETKNANHYYDADVWTLAGEKFRGKLHKGETAYMELVGYTPSGSFIQPGHDYRANKNEFDIYIYRMTQTNVDGVVTELTQPQVTQRALEMGFHVCPEIFYGRAKDFLPSFEGTDSDIVHFGDAFFQYISETYVYDQDSQFCNNKVPEEGVVVRLETGTSIENFKLKSFAHLNFESKQLDKGEADIEAQE